MFVRVIRGSCGVFCRVFVHILGCQRFICCIVRVDNLGYNVVLGLQRFQRQKLLLTLEQPSQRRALAPSRREVWTYVPQQGRHRVTKQQVNHTPCLLCAVQWLAQFSGVLNGVLDSFGCNLVKHSGSRFSSANQGNRGCGNNRFTSRSISEAIMIFDAPSPICASSLWWSSLKRIPCRNGVRVPAFFGVRINPLEL